MELIHYWRVLRRWAWLIILCPFVAALVAGVVSLALPKVYEAKVALLVRPAQPLSGDPSVAALTADQILRTYARWMTEPPILQKVISDQNLQTDPAALSRQITVTPESNTTILDVAVRDNDPARAMNIANTLVNDFIAQVKDADKDIVSELKQRGHDAQSFGDWTMKVGGMQAVALDPMTGVMTGAADPRRDGYAVAL